MHAPKILLLDEPTTGLDVQNRTQIWNLLREINRTQNITIVMTTQYLEEADQLCNRIGIVDHGKLIALGTPSELRQRIGMSNVIEISADREALPKLAAICRKIGLEPKLLSNKVVAPGGARATENIEKVIKAISESKIKIQNISMHEPTIDDVFIKLTGSEARDTTGSFKSGRVGMMRGR
jgi:ABC-2 type transport system ATP-binding protein